MEGRKTCKGCGTVVVKPVTCNRCNTVSHPGCLSRTGHAFSNGQFGVCTASPTATTSNVDSDSNATILDKIKVLLRKEFDVFRNEMREMYRADMAEIREEIRGLSIRVDRMEELLEASQRSGSPELVKEEIIAELEDRQKRSPNLIFYNLEEAEDDTCADEALVKDIINKIIPNEAPVMEVSRLGKRLQGRVRPLKVALPSKQLALRILRNKSRYSGPVKIAQDQTVKQRNHLRDLQAQLKSLKDAGGNNKTIRYKNGVPSIVNVNANASSATKN